MTLAEFVMQMGFKTDEKSVQEVNNTINSIKANATRVLGMIGVGLSLASMNSLVEEVDAINDGLNQAFGKLEDMAVVQERIKDAANECRMSYGAMGRMATKMYQTGMFNSEEAVTFTKNVSKLIAAGGKGEGEISGIISMLNRSFSTGNLNPLVLTQIIKEAPQFADVLAKSFGRTKQDLLDMAKNGELTVESIKDVTLKSTAEANEAYAQTTMHISDAIKIVRNEWGVWLHDVDEDLKITKTLSEIIVDGFEIFTGLLKTVSTGISKVNKLLGGGNNLFKLMIALLTAIGGLMLWQKWSSMVNVFNTKMKAVADTYKAIKTAIMGINKQQALMFIGVLILLGVIEEIYYFMNGKKKTAIEESLKAAGISVEETRKALNEAWETVKEIVKEFGSGFLEGFTYLLKEMAKFFNSDSGKVMLAGIGQAIKAIVDLVVELMRYLGENKSAAETFGKLLGFATSLIPIFIMLGKVAMGIGKIFPYIMKFIGLFTKIVPLIKAVGVLFGVSFGWAAAGIALVVAAFVWLIFNLDKVKKAFFNVLDVIQNYLDEIWQFVQDTVKNIVDKFNEGDIVGAFEAIWDACVKILTDLNPVKWGADIINGIVNGLTGSESSLTDKLKSLAGTIKAFLGFSVPEKGPLHDADTYMPDMIDLFTEGIEKNKSTLVGAVEALGSDISDKSKGATTQTAGMAMGGNVSKVINQNVEINNQFNGDKAIQQSAASAMTSSAGDITNELYRGMAYAW